MTRFWITLEEGINFVLNSMKIMKGGEIFVPKIPSIKIVDLIKAFDSTAKIKIVGIRPGEKLHEVMIPEDEAVLTVEFKKFFVIKPTIKFSRKINYSKYNLEIGKKVLHNFVFKSDQNNFLSTKQINSFLKNNNFIL